ncbi:MAG: hypothetical protein IT559_08265 [Alphaproteobacteria bacterium]|nr:hypothetical protein [Alphaproteobacteria bacterium]
MPDYSKINDLILLTSKKFANFGIIDMLNFGSFSNRELALMIWVALIVIAILFKSDWRKLCKPILKILSERVIIVAFAVYYVYVAFLVFFLEDLHLWDTSQLKNTVIWSIFVGISTIFRVASQREEKHHIFFKKWLHDSIGVTVFVEFLVSFKTFSLIAELILQPFLALIVMVGAYSESRDEYKKAEQLCNVILGIAFIVIAYHAVQGVFVDYNVFASVATLKDFITPILLSIFFTPFLYVLYAYSTYETFFIRMQWIFKDEELRKFAKFQALLAFITDLDLLLRWGSRIQNITPRNKAEIKESIRDIKDLKIYEKNPPVIEPSDGWSPYKAQKFLEEHKIIAGDYYQRFEEEGYSACSRMLEIGEQILMKDNVSYYLEGNARAVTRLKLYLNINNPDNSVSSEKFFDTVCVTLYRKAVSEDVPQSFLKLLKQDEGNIVLNNYLQVTAEKRIWEAGIKGGYSREIIFEITSSQAQ